MATRSIVLHIASCDVCGLESDEGAGWGESPEEAIADLTRDELWTRVGDRIVCDLADPDHDAERGGESPRLLRTGADAMAVSYGT